MTDVLTIINLWSLSERALTPGQSDRILPTSSPSAIGPVSISSCIQLELALVGQMPAVSCEFPQIKEGADLITLHSFNIIFYPPGIEFQYACADCIGCTNKINKRQRYWILNLYFNEQHKVMTRQTEGSLSTELTKWPPPRPQSQYSINWEIAECNSCVLYMLIFCVQTR